MKKWQIILIIFLLLALAGLGFYRFFSGKNSQPNPSSSPTPAASPSISEKARKEYTFDDKIALASYYGWYYKNAAWGELTNAEHPLAGSYNPQDDKTIDYQLTLATDVGLDGFIFSWNGINNANDKAFVKMLGQIETSTQYPTFKMAPLFENVNFEYKGPNKTFIDELVYLVKMSKDHPAFLKLNGLPVIFVYNPQTISLERWEEIIGDVKALAGEAYYIAMPDNWDVPDDYFKYFQTITTYADKYIPLNDISAHYANLKKQGKPLIATLIGGTTKLDKNGVSFDRSGGKYLQARYDIAKKNQTSWLYITSWNEWYEFSQIEPSRESKFETASYLREILATFKNTTLKNASSVMTVNRGSSQTKIKNEGPGNIYYVRCGHTDKSLLLVLVMRAGEEKTFDNVCYDALAYTVNNQKLEY